MTLCEVLEYKATGQGADWLAHAWEIQRNGADYLVRMHDATPAGAIHLLPGNSTEPHYDAWIHFAGYAVPALRPSAWPARGPARRLRPRRPTS
jgi:hypothetical protein